MEKSLTLKETLALVLSFEEEMNLLIGGERGFSGLGRGWWAGE